MKTESLNVDKRDFLLDRLLGRVFHLTPRTAYGEIQLAGYISHNQSGCYPIYTGSTNSYGRLHNCVCLFDLRSDNFEIIQNTLNCYDFLGPSWFSKHGRKYITWDLAYLFLSPQYYNRLIPNSQVYEYYRETGQCLQAVPKYEVWIEDRIPLCWIESTLLVKIREPVGELTRVLLEVDRRTRSAAH